MDIASIGQRIGRTAHAALQPVGRAATSPKVAAPGFRLASAAALAWGRMLGGQVRTEGDLTVVSGLPSWAFGRGGTTVGSTFLTRDAVSKDVLEHEDVHRQQWQRYGLAFIPMYFAAGVDATKNRWEVEAGLEKGGYVRSSTPPRHAHQDESAAAAPEAAPAAEPEADPAREAAPAPETPTPARPAPETDAAPTSADDQQA